MYMNFNFDINNNKILEDNGGGWVTSIQTKLLK